MSARQRTEEFVMAGFPSIGVVESVLGRGLAEHLAASGLASSISFATADFPATRVNAFAFLIGTQGADTLRGGGGPDFIEGLGGNDRAFGGTGDDFVSGGNGNDYLAGDGPVAFNDPTFPTAGDDTIVGGDGDDTMFGDADFYAAHLREAAGSNLLFGGAGNDSIIAGYGADTVFSGDGDDFIQGHGSPVPSGSGGVFARDGDFGDSLFGGGGGDTINGAGGDDVINGGEGDDSLIGGVDNDTLAGGTGADRFVFGIPTIGRPFDTGHGPGSRDVVLDFRTGEDQLDLRGYGSRAIRWEYEAEGDATIVVIPSSSQSVPDAEIELRGVRDLTADDVILL